MSDTQQQHDDFKAALTQFIATHLSGDRAEARAQHIAGLYAHPLWIAIGRSNYRAQSQAQATQEESR